MFDIFGIVFAVIFIAVFCIFIFVLVKSLARWNKNNHSPRLTVKATAVSKRMDVSHTAHTTGNNTFTTPSTTYYVTFQVESGDRMELILSGREYGMICEGDIGSLTFQGTRYIGFERENN